MEFSEPVMRPPQEINSIILRVTEGCTWNKCNFCYISRGYLFRAMKPEQLEADAREISRFYPPYANIYLAGSNPFALPARKLKEYIRVLRNVFPDFGRVSMQSRIDDIPRKSDEELLELKNLGLTHLYIGTENGHEETLKLMNKGHTAEDTVEQLKRLDQAGITYTLFYVLGLGGKGAGIASGKATAAMFNRVHPTRITTTGMTLFEKSPVSDMAKRGEFVEATEKEKIEELRAFLTDLEADAFYDGIHYLNPLNYRFHNSDRAEKKKVLDDIDDILNSHSAEELELMVNRRRMISL